MKTICKFLIDVVNLEHIYIEICDMTVDANNLPATLMCFFQHVLTAMSEAMLLTLEN